MDENPTAAAAMDEPTAAGPFTANVFFLNEDILVDKNVLDIDDSSEETDKRKKDSSSSEEESDSSSSEETLVEVIWSTWSLCYGNQMDVSNFH